jgi:hypothetical protein
MRADIDGLHEFTAIRTVRSEEFLDGSQDSLR